MEYGALTLVPILLIIVMAVISRKAFESLLAGSIAACIIMYGTGFLPAWTEHLLTAVTDRDNGWVLLMCGLFGSLIALLRESNGVNGFTRIGEKLCKTERTALLGTFILGIVIFVDDYLNMLTVGTCMRKICDKRKVPREALAYLLDSTGAPVCMLLPFSTWSAFYIALFMNEEPVKKLGFSSGLQMYLHCIPFIFYAIITVVIVFLFALGKMPKIGAMKKAYIRTEKSGETFGSESRQLNEKESEIPGKAADGNVLDFLIPVAVLIAVTILSGDILTAVIAALIICLLLYVPRKKMTFSDWSRMLIVGFCDMLPVLAILACAFTLARCMDIMGLPVFVIETFTPLLTPQSFPVICFLAVALLTFATGSTWGISAIVVPILLPLSAAVGADTILTCAAILSGSTFGSHACFYSDATILAATAAKIDTMEHALSQLPYALIAAAVTCAGYILCGLK